MDLIVDYILYGHYKSGGKTILGSFPTSPSRFHIQSAIEKHERERWRGTKVIKRVSIEKNFDVLRD